MEAETQTEEEQVNIIEPSDPITPLDIGNFASGTDSMGLWCWNWKSWKTVAKSVAEAKQFCTTDLDDFDFFE